MWFSTLPFHNDEITSWFAPYEAHTALLHFQLVYLEKQLVSICVSNFHYNYHASIGHMNDSEYPKIIIDGYGAV